MYNVYSLLIKGNIKVRKSYLFEWLGDFNLIWHSVKTQLMFAFKMLPWVFIFSIGASIAMSWAGLFSESLEVPDTMTLAVLIVAFIIAVILLIYQVFRYQGGLFECAAVPTRIITPTFHIGMIKMKYNLRDYCLLMVSYLPLILIFSAPVVAYEFIVGEYDAVYYALMVLETVGSNFVVSPLIGIAGMMRYNVGAKIPPEHFFKSFGMKIPKEYTGENVGEDGTAEKPEITKPEPIGQEDAAEKDDIGQQNEDESAQEKSPDGENK